MDCFLFIDPEFFDCAYDPHPYLYRDSSLVLTIALHVDDLSIAGFSIDEVTELKAAMSKILVMTVFGESKICQNWK